LQCDECALHERAVPDGFGVSYKTAIAFSLAFVRNAASAHSVVKRPKPRRFLLRLHAHRVELECVVEVHGNDAVVALFALVIMDLSGWLRAERLSRC
jgi:hypothetical protein